MHFQWQTSQHKQRIHLTTDWLLAEQVWLQKNDENSRTISLYILSFSLQHHHWWLLGSPKVENRCVNERKYENKLFTWTADNEAQRTYLSYAAGNHTGNIDGSITHYEITSGTLPIYPDKIASFLHIRISIQQTTKGKLQDKRTVNKWNCFPY